jgi:hypothetical protein
VRAQLLDVPAVVSGEDWAWVFTDQLENPLLEVGVVFPRADLRRCAGACVRGLLAPLSRENGW